MKVFFSGIGKGTVEGDPRLGSPRFRLFSCHGNYFQFALKTFPLCATIDQEFEVMLDSGAFTAWTKGEEIEVEELIRTYGTVLDKWGHLATKCWLINLDKIPGSPGRTAGPEEMDEAIRISDVNYERLVKEFGDVVLPVFHQGESSARLAEVAAMGDYINVSPRNDMGERLRVKWAKEVHSKLPPGVRTHGLAATGLPMMQDVPWHSVDSASWIMVASYGHVWWPGTMQLVSCSDDSPTRYEAGKHYTTMAEPQQKAFEAFAEKYGMTMDELRSDFTHRMIWNRLVQSEIYRDIPAEVSKPLQDGLFDL